MKCLNRKLSRLYAGLFTVATLFLACAKESNPNKLPTSVPESEYVGQSSADIIKILAIGNSFSENAIESNLYELAKENGKTVIVGNMYIGGASLSQHAQNAAANASVYEYRKINMDGVKRNFLKVSIGTALADEKWDYISFQQASPLSGLNDPTRQDLTTIFNYVKSKANNPNVKYIYHQTWAYAPNTSNTGFANYDNDQTAMYNGIISVSQNVKDVVPIDIVVPAGTAIQDVRTSILGESVTVSDGYHLNELGKYTAACTWFEALFGTSVVGAKYKPAGISNFEISVAQNAAHFAVLKPLEVTSMADFQVESGPLQYPVLIDFGNATPSPSWNQISSYTEGAKVNLKDSVNAFIGISLAITERFNAINVNGATGTNTSLNMPDNVSSQNFFGNSRGPLFNNITTPQSAFELSGLDKSLTYNFCFFGSRAASDNRETLYIVAGENGNSASLNAASNSTNIACISNIKPDAEGKVKVTVTSGPNNFTSNGWFYINAARITSNN